MTKKHGEKSLGDTFNNSLQSHFFFCFILSLSLLLMLFIIGHGSDKNLVYLTIAPGKPVYMVTHWTMSNTTD